MEHITFTILVLTISGRNGGSVQLLTNCSVCKCFSNYLDQAITTKKVFLKYS